MKRKTLLPLLLAGTLAAGAQINLPGNAGYIARAEAMLADHNYTGCLDQIAALEHSALTPAQREQAAWLCARARVNVDAAAAVVQLRQFLDEYRASALRHKARILLGDCLLEDSPAAALEEYERVPMAGLSADEAAALAYHKAYAMLKVGDLDRAAALFGQASANSKWMSPANFYRGYIAYCRHDYRQAVDLLEKSDRSSAPGNMADYYLAQIYYVQGDSRRALEYARRLLQRPGVESQYTAEANRIAGEALYDSDRREALAYLRKYVSMAEVPERSALYLLGTAEFGNGNYPDAMKYLEPVTAGDDSDAMTQSAYLYIGQALMKEGKRDAAVLAFDKALKMDFDTDVQEAAYYNYATATAGGAKVPFGSSVAVFEDFLRRFPDGRYASAVQEYLVSGYLTDSNFDAALASINRMHSPGPKVLEAKQKVLYALGTRALAASKIQQALTLLVEADGLARYDSATAARVDLSLGEAYYRTSDYKRAADRLNRYLRNAPANDVNRALAHYDLGYVYFADKDYKNAAESFKRFVDNPGLFGREVRADALNRLADTNFYTGDFSAAEADYGRSYELLPDAGDYPLFQQALIMGYRRRHKDKIEAIGRLLDEYPTSSLVPDALLELTESYIQLGDNKSAIDTYRRLVADYSGTEQGRRGYLQMALTMLNNGDRKGAIAAYKDVVRLYPTSDEARMAVDELKRLTAEDGNIADFGRWLAGIESAPQLDVADADRLTFEAAEKAWLTAHDTGRLERYLTDYPHGASRVRVLGYMMEAATDRNATGDALTFATEIVEKYPDSPLTENALIVKADAEHSLGRGGDALRTWTMLEGRASSPRTVNMARTGIMRVARDLSDQARVIAAADALLASSTIGAEERNEAVFSRALALDLSGHTAKAREGWEQLAGNTDDLYGAKSAYYLAQSYFDAKDNDEARRRTEALIDAATPHTYWLARAFILLSDIYNAEGKTFEAREYLKSLRDNYPGSETDIFQMIDTRLK